MTPDQRLDYFRSEFEGKLSQARKEMADIGRLAGERIRQLEERLEKTVHELKDLEMSAR